MLAETGTRVSSPGQGASKRLEPLYYTRLCGLSDQGPPSPNTATLLRKRFGLVFSAMPWRSVFAIGKGL